MFYPSGPSRNPAADGWTRFTAKIVVFLLSVACFCKRKLTSGASAQRWKLPFRQELCKELKS